MDDARIWLQFIIGNFCMKSRIDKYLKSAVFESSLGLPCGQITEMKLQKTVRLLFYYVLCYVSTGLSFSQN